MKKNLVTALLSLVSTLSIASLEGSSYWHGRYNVINALGQQATIRHTPDIITIELFYGSAFITSNQDITYSGNFSGYQFDNLKLSVHSSKETFESDIYASGLIIQHEHDKAFDI